jgi:predicted phosphoribosyltransferase
MSSLRGYRDRVEAGRVLARSLQRYAGRPDVIVLGLPRGGVPVAAEVARALHAPLDVFIVRKLGAPGNAELAMGALASGDVQILNSSVLSEYKIAPDEIARVADRERHELRRREEAYRQGRKALPLTGACVVVVDDGLATGASMRAAVAALRGHRPGRLIAAVPAGSREACADLAKEVDELICPLQPDPFYSVGMWYTEFWPTVQRCLEQTNQALVTTASDKHRSMTPW